MARRQSLVFWIWDSIIIAGVGCAALVIPAHLVLDVLGQPEYRMFEWCLTILFSADIVLHVLDPRRLRALTSPSTEKGKESYGSGWLIVDLISVVPYGLFPIPAAFRLLRLVKVARVAEFMARWRRREVQNANILSLVFFLFWLSLSAHWLTCGWIALRESPVGQSGTDIYVSALYFCVTTLTTVGFGDITAATSAQRLYVIGIMMIGVGVYGYVIGNVASLLTKIDPAKAHFLENMEKLNAFMRYRSIPASLQLRIREYYYYLWEKRLGYDEAKIIDSLPQSLRTEVSLFLKQEFLEKVPIFKDATDEFMRDIAVQMTPVVFAPGDYVVRVGEVAHAMYFINRGELEVVSKDGKTVYTTLKDGNFFGEIALFYNQPRMASVRAVEYCDLYRLDREMFERVLRHYPDIAGKIEQMAKERQSRS